MKRFSENFRVLVLACVLTTFSFLAGCNEDPVTTQYQRPTVTDSPDGPVELRLDSVKVLVKDVVFDLRVGSRSGNGRRPSADAENVSSLKLNLNSISNYITSVGVLNGVYDMVTFRIETLSPDVRPPDPDFIFNGQPYCIVVYGVYNMDRFVYRSYKSFSQTLTFDPAITIGGGQKTQVALRVNPMHWFFTGKNYIDPTNPANQNVIETRIEESLLVNSETGQK